MSPPTSRLSPLAFAAALAATVASAAGAAPWRPEADFSKAPVYVATNATVPEIEAARLILRAQAMVAGGEDPLTNAVPAVATNFPAAGIVVGWQGSALVAPLAKDLGLVDWYEAKPKLQDTVVQKVVGGTLVVAGNSPQGAYWSAGDLLYRNGARFLHGGGADGEEGTFLEYMTGLMAPRDWRHQPEALIRMGFNCRCGASKLKGAERDAELVARNQFAARNGADATGPLNGGRAREWLGVESIQPPVNEFKKHPDWFPLIDGKRWRPAPGSGWEWVVEGCWSNDEFADWVVENNERRYQQRGGSNIVAVLDVTNSDGGRRCECPDCVRLRASYPDESSCYFDYQTKIANRIKARHPEMRVEASAYIMSRPYPKAGNGVLRGIEAIEYCPYSRCFIHPYSDRKCPTNKADLDRMAEWKKADLPIGDFDYMFDVFQPPMGLPVWELAADVVDYWMDYNRPHRMPQMFIEAAVEGGCGSRSRIAAYVFARKLWDASQSADDHLRDWCRVGFGEGAEPMLEFLRAEAAAWTNQPVHITACFNNPLGTAKTFMTAELAAKGSNAFDRAEALLAAAAKGAAPRDANRIRKQRAALAFERKVFEEWTSLRAKALEAAMEVALELGEPDDKGFDRAERLPLATRRKANPDGEFASGAVQFYRTADALRVRVTSNDPFFKPQEWKERRGDEGRFPWGFKPGSMELFLQAPGQSGYRHFAVAADGAVYDAIAMDARAIDSADWKIDSVQRDGLWQLTLTIPWRVLRMEEPPKAGEAFHAVVIDTAHRRDAKSGEVVNYEIGLPFPAAHDIGVGAALVVDDFGGRRPDEGDAK